MSDLHKERVNNNVTSLSKKLLEGWTLLSESCPDPSCNVPLVKNKAHSKVFCVSCEKTYGSVMEALSAATPPPSSPIPRRGGAPSASPPPSP
eukprot:CAMPEP_0198216360 /NCGR_PEP_ID=MMETSP1445-20131203/56931_1 /TAXON_ID=36898 /ORGANISM="Pyramimonas sp., Strain CCMP2087" /LENGTH=91 /DNA_ID=CAMNT_0043892557 /DNA_START=126 /DNA_END=397 /DNA_ORIENTATION=-